MKGELGQTNMWVFKALRLVGPRDGGGRLLLGHPVRVREKARCNNHT